MFSWGEAGTVGTGELRFVGVGWSKVSHGRCVLLRNGESR